MAAIDKMYIKSYEDYDDLRRWAIAYYPKLLFYFYTISLTYKEFGESMDRWVKREEEIIKKEYKKIGRPLDTHCDSVQILIDHYKKTADYDCSREQAEYEVNYIINRYKDILDGNPDSYYTFPAMNTPLSVDRKLLWICPVPCVRKYLETQCGYKTKWYHKLFWRGKKYFWL